MNKPMHTPGPWFVFDNGHCVGGPAGPMGSAGDESNDTAGVALCGMRLRTHPEQEGNARLIAAAPTLKVMLAAGVELFEGDTRRSAAAWLADCRTLLNLLPAEQEVKPNG